MKFLTRLRSWRRKRSYGEEILTDHPFVYWPLAEPMNGDSHDRSDSR